MALLKNLGGFMSIKRCMSSFIGGGLLLASTLSLGAQAAPGHKADYYPNFAPDTARISGAINNNQLATLAGSQMTNAVASNDTGALPASQTIRNVTLQLKRSDAKQKQFDNYVRQLTTPGSPYFHHWLTAAQLATFGPAQADITKVTQWLQSQGMASIRVAPSGTMIQFSGTAQALGHAFHTELHSYTVDGQKHFANSSAQQIPAALTPLVKGVVSLHNFFPKPQYHNVGLVQKDKTTGKWKNLAKSSAAPQFTVPGSPIDPQISYDVAPADFNTIYNVNPLWNQSTPIRGAGQTIAVIERTDVLPADVASFRSAFLPADAQGVVSYQNPAAYVGDTSCLDPGRNPDEGEAALDAEWVGAAAPDANITLASCDDTNSAMFGPLQAAQNLIYAGFSGSPVPSVISLSYGECEDYNEVDPTIDTAGGLWELAASMGITVFVSTGDSGSVGCDDHAAASTHGLAVNGLASSPFDVAVGGTDFNDFTNYNYAPYWASSNSPLYSSALSYIPEMTWNNSCASSVVFPLYGYADALTLCNSQFAYNNNLINTAGGSGGVSSIYMQPEWESGIYGQVNYSSRTLPDVSLFAASGFFGHALVYCMSDVILNQGGNPNAPPIVDGAPCDYTNPADTVFNSAGGTSFAAPAMAGVQALINQAAGQQQLGNVTPVFYALAAKEYGTNGSPNTGTLQACNSSQGSAIGAACIFNDVTVGDIDEPCYAGTSGCYSSDAASEFGIAVGANSNSLTLAPAWKAGTGYDLATGLGSINVTNLANAVAKFYQPFERGYIPPDDFMASASAGLLTDGNSDIALVDPVKGLFTAIGMKGSTVIQQTANQPTPVGYTVGAVGFFGGDFEAALAWTGPGNTLYICSTDAQGQCNNYNTSTSGGPYPAGWQLVGEAVPDGTGVSQIFWFNAATAQFGWWSFSDGGYYQPSISALTTVTPGYVPHLADVNGDGFSDIVWTGVNDNSVYVWINNQQGGYTAHRIADHPAGYTLFGAGDVNGDGKTDLIWTSPATNQMAWWDMDGFTVTNQQTRSITPGYTMASIADFDGDGLVDILWVGTAGDAYEWQSTGDHFQSQRVADVTGKPLVIPAGMQVQANRLQGSATGTQGDAFSIVTPGEGGGRF
jgi:hypothetical protein